MPEKKKQSPLAETYPNIATFVFNDGYLELGYEYNSRTYARAICEDNLIWSGGKKTMTLEELLEAADKGIAEEWYEQ